MHGKQRRHGIALVLVAGLALALVMAGLIGRRWSRGAA